MKRKIALLLVLVLSISVLLASCAQPCDKHVDANRDGICDRCKESAPPVYLGFSGIYKADYDEGESDKILYGKAELNSKLTDMEAGYVDGNLLIFRDSDVEAGEPKALVVNLDSGEIVLTLNKEDDDATVIKDVSIHNPYYGDCFIRITETNATDEKNVSYKQTLYTALGQEIASKQSKVSADKANIQAVYIARTEKGKGNLYVIEGKVYEIMDDVATYKFDKGFSNLDGLSEYDDVTDKNYYCYSGSTVLVYDLNNNLVAQATLPAGYESGIKSVLSDGNVLIQCAKELPWDATDYDFYSGETKYDCRTIIFNIADGSTKDVELNYFIDAIYNKASYSYFEEDYVEGAVENVAICYPIVNKSIDEYNPVVVNFDNNMFLVGFLGQEIPNQEDEPNLIADNRFIVYNKANQKFLINEKGEVIGEVTAASYDSSLQLFKMNGKYYDLDLKFVFDENEIEYQQYSGNYSYANYLYYDTETVVDGGNEKTVYTYYIRDGITFKKIDIPENASSINVYENYFSYNWYVEEKDEDDNVVTKRYTSYCNKNGEKIHTVHTNEEGISKTSYVLQSGEIFILRVQISKYNKDTYSYEYSVKYYVAK